VATVDGPLTDDTITYAYDVLGRVSSRTLNSVSDTWTYDALGRVSAQGDPIGTFSYAYDGPTGRLQQLTYPNGQTSTYSYLNNAGDRRLQDIHHQTGTGTTLSRFSYAYDPLGNITTWTQQYGTDVKAYDFTYDAAEQLTGAVYRTTGATPTILKRYGYAYDPTGNRTTARTDDRPLLYAYNNMNRLTTQSGGGVVEFKGTTSEAASVTVAGKPAAGAGTSTFAGSAMLASGTSTVAIAATDASGNTATASYEVDVAASTASSSSDANGNLTTRETKTYEWDAANRLVRVTDGATELARFVYDGYGRRAQKITAVARTYVYDGMDIDQERIGSATARTVHGPGIDQPLASVDASGTVSYYLTDHLGSIVQHTSAAGAVTLTRQYDPYGVPLQGGGTSGYAFTGREWDTETALQYSRARYYSTELGRFLSDDPLGLGGGINLQQYVSGNPVRFVDPLGLCGEEPEQRRPSAGPPPDGCKGTCLLDWVGQQEMTISAMPLLPGGNPAAVVTFAEKHIAKHIVSDAALAAFKKEATAQVEKAILESTQLGTEWWGTVVINGEKLLYKVYQWAPGVFNIGTGGWGPK
jgi:RHS repeat-associated protein